jgi:hypothetical protein
MKKNLLSPIAGGMLSGATGLNAISDGFPALGTFLLVLSLAFAGIALTKHAQNKKLS